MTVETALDLATGLTPEQFTNRIDELNDITAGLEDLTLSAQRDAIMAQSKGRYDSLLGMVGAYSRVMGQAKGISPETIEANPQVALELLPPQLQGSDVGMMLLQDLGLLSDASATGNSDDPYQDVDMEAPGAIEALGTASAYIGFDPNDDTDMIIATDTTWEELPVDEDGTRYLLDEQGNKQQYVSRVAYQADLRDQMVETQLEIAEVNQAAQNLTAAANLLGYENFDPADYSQRTAVFERLTIQERQLNQLMGMVQSAKVVNDPATAELPNMWQDFYTEFSPIPQELENAVRGAGFELPRDVTTMASLEAYLNNLYSTVTNGYDAYTLLNRQGR
jgi:hypothetical protein